MTKKKKKIVDFSSQIKEAKVHDPFTQGQIWTIRFWVSSLPSISL